MARQRKQEWKYHASNASPVDGCISVIHGSLHFDGSRNTGSLQLFYRGVVGNQDGAVDRIPSCICVEYLQEDVTLNGDFGSGGHKLHGRVARANGTIASVRPTLTRFCVSHHNY